MALYHCRTCVLQGPSRPDTKAAAATKEDHQLSYQTVKTPKRKVRTPLTMASMRHWIGKRRIFSDDGVYCAVWEDRIKAPSQAILVSVENARSNVVASFYYIRFLPH
jgi:hypothetical protein